ncbi:OmpA family protein [uncultured Vibrio sp.]|uniref:OmpA family protein n=1 Tax=uncultured Vibrio sp. TaxID=114054 RepID=UPI00262A4986|nr:OmpA family protein [uncultured Vibrio sp.]
MNNINRTLLVFCITIWSSLVLSAEYFGGSTGLSLTGNRECSTINCTDKNPYVNALYGFSIGQHVSLEGSIDYVGNNFDNNGEFILGFGPIAKVKLSEKLDLAFKVGIELLPSSKGSEVKPLVASQLLYDIGDGVSIFYELKSVEGFNSDDSILHGIGFKYEFGRKVESIVNQKAVALEISDLSEDAANPSNFSPQVENFSSLEIIYFEFDKHDLTELAIEKLIGLDKQSNNKFIVRGFSDNVGEQDYNLALSKYRSKAVYNFLKEQGVDPSMIKLEYFGESNPKFDNKTRLGRSLNRRVEIEVSKNWTN